MYHIVQVLVKQGAVIAIANKQGDTAYSKARPTLKRKLQGECWLVTCDVVI